MGVRAALVFSVLVVFLGTSAVTLLGVANVVTVQGKHLDWLVPAVCLEAAAFVFWLLRDWFGAARRQALELSAAIRGAWWQSTWSSSSDSELSFVWVECAEASFVLRGETFDASGARVARWRSEAVAVYDSGKRIFYVWSGEKYEEGSGFSGVGYCEFHASAGEEVSRSGIGWYTTGKLEQLELTGKRSVRYQRASSAEIEVMSGSEVGAKEQLVRQLAEKV